MRHNEHIIKTKGDIFMNTKRILIIMLSVVLIVSMFTFSASAANTTDVDFIINIGSYSYYNALA